MASFRPYYLPIALGGIPAIAVIGLFIRRRRKTSKR